MIQVNKKKKESFCSCVYLDVTHGHVLQHPDAVGPGVVVAGVTSGSVRAHSHLLVECSGQMFSELLTPAYISLLCFTLLLMLLLLLLPAACSRGLPEDLLQHPAPAGTLYNSSHLTYVLLLLLLHQHLSFNHHDQVMLLVPVRGNFI